MSMPFRAGRWRLAVLLCGMVVLAGCQDHHRWNQKLTIVVDTSSGEVSGSSVVEVHARFGRLPLSNSEVNYNITGEATVVEVAPGRYLFALLGRDEERYYRAVRERIATPYRGEWLKMIPKMNEVAVLEPDNYPMLVTFDDINDPKSVRLVDPENLIATFGAGFRLSEITLEITNEEVTNRRIEQLLEWLGPYPETRLAPATGQTTNIPFNSLVSYGDFIRRNK